VVAAAEKLVTYTPLGIRLWDPVVDRQIKDALLVTAKPVLMPQKIVHAAPTLGGVYAFSHLPGMRGVEYGYEQATDSPPSRHGFVIEINDSLNRYVSVAFHVELPLSYPGPFLSNSVGSPGNSLPKGVYLYSSISRNMSSNMAVIRGELLEYESRKPAAHALLKVQTESGESWYGIADEHGRYAIVFPYPDLQEGFGGSPLSLSSKPLHEQRWELELSIFYSPSSRQNLPGTALPNYLTILNQGAAMIWPRLASDEGVPISQLTLPLSYHRPAVAKTGELSKLLISPLP